MPNPRYTFTRVHLPHLNNQTTEDILSIIGMSQLTPIDIADGRYEEILNMQGLSL